MTEPYLILHKVRGEPAFDIAIEVEKLGPESEELWIIPTSGHRVHAAWKEPLSQILNDAGTWQNGHQLVEHALRDIVEQCVETTEWSRLPDHYHASEPIPKKTSAPRPKPQFTSDDL